MGSNLWTWRRAERVARNLARLALAFVLVACGRDAPKRAAEPTAAPQRIVALTVGSTDTLALLGALERVVAVEEDCFVPGTEKLVRIRNDDHAGPSKALNVEAILALRPDLVIAKEDLRPALDGRGLNVLWMPSESGLDTVVPMVEHIGARLGVPERANALIDTMRKRMRSIDERVAALPRVRVYYEAGKPGRTMGAKTIVGEMIQLAGGDNIAGTSELANPTLSSEAIIAADPQVIVLSPWSDSPDDVAQRPGWERISAVRDGRVHRVPERDRKLQYPSPSCVEGCEEMLVPWLHPELALANGR